MSSLYLVQRGPRPEWHRAPYHPVLVTPRRDIARWEAGTTSEQAWIWEILGPPPTGWLLVRWQGLDLDYGYIVRGMLLPDGTTRSIDHRREHPETFALLPGAIWWSPRKMPRWIEDEGAQYPTDRFTQQCILDRFADDGASGWGRPIPDWWTEPVQEVAS